MEPFPTRRDGAPTLTGPFPCFPGRHLLLLKCFRGSASSLGKALEYSLPKKPLVIQSLPGTQAPRRLLTKLKLSSYSREVLQHHGDSLLSSITPSRRRTCSFIYPSTQRDPPGPGDTPGCRQTDRQTLPRQDAPAGQPQPRSKALQLAAEGACQNLAAEIIASPWSDWC